MKYNIRGNKIEITDAIRNYLIDKLKRLEKYDTNNMEAKIIVSTKGKDQKVEITIWTGKYNIRAEEVNNDLYASIDLVVDKIEKQFNKYKDKIIKKRKKKETIEEEYIIGEELPENIVKRKEVFLKPIDENEAITQMELLGHTFFVFKNVDDKKINVLYKRQDGNYGIIEAK